ncbi:PucR family transcriptional regulator [Nocardia gamkensis]|uniref:PucR family transcriptional regulator n=1 Tax=Nocardia gamkensis TaxID=352869 RepID=A0A7X6LA27_9NOCA|nr:helix-turn-helix domain-containing protein [Nocardia gamkensis]NKY30661.1 PucR family transcriptional regulator [Nocardia gamkensis]NQE71097.1 Transcriptional activator AdeR [Nocardia gamkensis]
MVTLDRLANVLGGYGVRLRLGSVARATPLRSVVIPGAEHDPAEMGDVLLGIGARSVSEVVDWAVSARAVVALFRGDEQTDDEPKIEGIAVLMIDPAVAWSEVAAVVYGLVLEGRETDAGRGPTDLFALADSLADAVGGAVTIEDRLSRVLAYSRPQQHLDPAWVETILGRQMPQWLRAVFETQGVFAHLAASAEPLFVPAQADRAMTGRMVVAVRVGRQLLGSIWVSSPAPLHGVRHRALTDGARTVALHLLRSRASADLERQVESELVIRLLEGTADATTVASRLGLASEGLRVLAVRARIAGEQHAALLLIFERATSGFGWSRSSRSALVGDTVYTVLPADQAATARRWISERQAALPTQMTVLAGISGVALARELALARQEADECLALHEARSADVPPLAYDESWDEILLQRLRTAGHSGRTPARGPISELRRHDRANSTQYVATLRAWLQAQGDLAEAGAQLGVHENTVRNRLRKMAEVTDLGLRDPRKRLAMMIELAVTETA